MERYSSRKVDELGRIILHGDLRKKLGLDEGARITPTVIGSVVILQRTDTGECEVSELGMITLPAEVRQQMLWKAMSEIAVYHTDSMLILKTA